MAKLAKEEAERRAIAAGRVFTPATPIDEEKLFAGRREQLRMVLDAVNQRGQHAIIFGERGVGKTSLANVIGARLTSPSRPIVAPHVNCDSADTHSKLWRKVFRQIALLRERRAAGFGTELKKVLGSAAEGLPEDIGSDDVRARLERLAAGTIPVVIIDEFDRLSSSTDRRLFADTVKTLSDYAVPATVILVGVADAVDGLIEEHQSIERALVQIQMPRMSPDELAEIINKGLGELLMEIEPEARNHIVLLSQGLPHYTHLLALHASRQALDDLDTAISLAHVEAALRQALEKAQESIQSAYYKATLSPHRGNLYAKVLLACALAPTDDFGFFAAVAVRDPIRRITRKDYDIPSYVRHLTDFSDQRRGSVLQKTGSKHRFKFRFVNPLMQPYVTMQGVVEGLVTREDVENFARRPAPPRRGSPA